MFTDSVLRELLNYSSPDPVLSVYLNTDTTEGTADALKLRLRTLLKGVHLPKDEAAIFKYFELERKWTGRSVAMFSSAAQNYFRAFPIAVPLRSRVFVGSNLTSNHWPIYWMLMAAMVWPWWINKGRVYSSFTWEN